MTYIQGIFTVYLHSFITAPKNNQQPCFLCVGFMVNVWMYVGFIYIYIYEPGSKLLVLGMVIQPLIGNPYNWYINPYYWVDDHPLLYENNGSLDPSTYSQVYTYFWGGFVPALEVQGSRPYKKKHRENLSSSRLFSLGILAHRTSEDDGSGYPSSPPKCRSYLL